MKEVKYTETLHVWEGVAVVKDEQGYKEIPLGIIQTDKKLKETGVKEEFKARESFPENSIAIEVKKLEDVSTIYVMDSDEFIKVAKCLKTVAKVGEETETETVQE